MITATPELLHATVPASILLVTVPVGHRVIKEGDEIFDMGILGGVFGEDSVAGYREAREAYDGGE